MRNSRSPWGVGVDHGLKATTRPMRVTGATRNVVHTLDGRPAFEVYREYAASKGVPEILLAIATALELLGAVSVVVGFRARWGALALLIFLVPVTLVFHNFWAVPAAQQQMEMANFLKNLAIAGGLLIIFGRGAGAFSIDNSREAARGEPVAVTRAAQ